MTVNTNNGLTTAPLGEVIVKSEDWINLNPLETYTEVSVRLWGRGVVTRGQRMGSEIGGSRRLRVRPRQFILSRIDARNGAFGLVPPELDGAVVSNDFPTFSTNNERLLPEFLGWLSRTRTFIEQCQSVSEGTTNRVRLDEGRFLQVEIPLPPLEEQQRIVAKVEHLAAKIDRARVCIEDIARKCDSLCRSIIMHGETTPTPISALVHWRRPDIKVDPSASYTFAGVYCFGRGVFRGETRLGLDFAYKTLTQVRSGEFVYPKLMAWEGALGAVPPDCDGCYVTPEFPVFQVRQDRVLPEVLDTYFKSPSVWQSLSGASTGTNVRRRRLNPRAFLNYRFPLPAREVQEKLRFVRNRTDRLKALQQQTAAELDALLPSILDKAFKGEL